ncbi:MAG: hypothetical protein GXP62_11370, partial [Oligoflexia bacterium]|nr:hypothetical protein [Oligoflexia bacterium]
NDAYLFTPAVDMGGIVTLMWSDPSANMDVYALNSNGEGIAAGWQVGDVDGGPEYFNAGSDFDVTFKAGQDYMISVQAWTGSAGDKPYTIEIEWLSP